MKQGDKFLITTTGAYNNTQWMQFITLRPNVILISENGTTHLIRRNETIESVTDNELIPEHLSGFDL